MQPPPFSRATFDIKASSQGIESYAPTTGNRLSGSSSSIYVRWSISAPVECHVVVNLNAPQPSSCIRAVIRPPGNILGSSLCFLNPQQQSSIPFTFALPADPSIDYFLLIDRSYKGVFKKEKLHGAAVLGSIHGGANQHVVHLYAIGFPAIPLSTNTATTTTTPGGDDDLCVGFAGGNDALLVTVKEFSNDSKALALDKVIQWTCIRSAATVGDSVLPYVATASTGTSLVETVTLVSSPVLKFAWGRCTDSLQALRVTTDEPQKQPSAYATTYSYMIATYTDVTIFLIRCDGLNKLFPATSPTTSITTTPAATLQSLSADSMRLIMHSKMERHESPERLRLVHDATTEGVTAPLWSLHAPPALPPLPGYVGPWNALEIWTCLQEPFLHLRVEHFHRRRLAGRYASEAKVHVLQQQAGAALAYMFAARTILMHTRWHEGLVSVKSGHQAYIKLMGFEANNPLHGDHPAHWHIAVRRVQQEITPHIYFTKDARLALAPTDTAPHWNLSCLFARVRDGALELSADDSFSERYILQTHDTRQMSESTTEGSVVVTHITGRAHPQLICLVKVADNTIIGRMEVTVKPTKESEIKRHQKVFMYNPITGREL